MRSCSHTKWLGVSQDRNGTSLIETSRLRNLINKIETSSPSQPSLVVLVGKAEKSVALRAAFGAKKNRLFRNKRRPGDVHLSLCTRSAFPNFPLLIADTELASQVPAYSFDRALCHKTHARSISRNRIGGDSVAQAIISDLLAPFVDVFCLFSSDIGGFRQVARLIAQWLDAGLSSTEPMPVPPRILIVSDKIGHGSIHESEARKALLWILREETEKDPFEQVSAIDVVALLPSKMTSSAARHRNLKARIAAAVDQVRRKRSDLRVLFSAQHFAAFMSLACDHFSSSTQRPFNFIEASRLCNPVPAELSSHLSNLVLRAQTPQMLLNCIVPCIASSILLASYPPESHGR